MKKKNIFVVFLTVIVMCSLLSGCSNSNSNNKDITAILRDFKDAKNISYNIVTQEKIDSQNNQRISIVNSNCILKRSPFSRSLTTIRKDQDLTSFVKLKEQYSNHKLKISRCDTQINDSNYKIDELGNITLDKQLETSIQYTPQSIEVSPSITQACDPFHMLIYLVEHNSKSFQLDSSNNNAITYHGYINPDTIVDYYINDGNDVFKEIYYDNYQGEMNREALMKETIRRQYNTLVEPLNALLFTNELIPITITKDLTHNTYSMKLTVASAKTALYKVMYTDFHDFSIHVNESSTEYKNISLQ